jgi:hypothetical protein
MERQRIVEALCGGWENKWDAWAGTPLNMNNRGSEMPDLKDDRLQGVGSSMCRCHDYVRYVFQPDDSSTCKPIAIINFMFGAWVLIQWFQLRNFRRESLGYVQ